MVVEIEAGENALALSNAKSLFSVATLRLLSGNNYDIRADGARFVMVQRGAAQEAEEEAVPPTVVIVENWFAEFRNRE